MGSQTRKCLIDKVGGNEDIAMAFYFKTEMKPVAKWLCARHRELALELGKWGINTGKSSKLYKITILATSQGNT